MIYLDNNATTHIDPAVAQRLLELYQDNSLANPASQHAPGRRALKLVETARNQLLKLTGAPANDGARVILTSGGTEANNLAILGRRQRKNGIVITAATEHPSVTESAQQLSLLGFEHRILPVDQQGACCLVTLEQWLLAESDRIAIVSVMMGNNETGIIQDIAAITALCQPYNVPVHSDVVQAIGKIPFDMSTLGLSAISLTAHKIHGPVGTGALITLNDLQLDPMLFGGGQQLGTRPGTEPVIPAVALAASVETTCVALREGSYRRVADMRDAFESKIKDATGAVIIGESCSRLPHTSNMTFSGVDRQALQMALDLAGIACSTGSACSSGSSRPSGSLVAMGYDDKSVQGSIRFSFSKFTTVTESDQAADVVIQTVKKISKV